MITGPQIPSSIIPCRCILILSFHLWYLRLQGGPQTQAQGRQRISSGTPTLKAYQTTMKSCCCCCQTRRCCCCEWRSACKCFRMIWWVHSQAWFHIKLNWLHSDLMSSLSWCFGLCWVLLVIAFCISPIAVRSCLEMFTGLLHLSCTILCCYECHRFVFCNSEIKKVY